MERYFVKKQAYGLQKCQVKHTNEENLMYSKVDQKYMATTFAS